MTNETQDQVAPRRRPATPCCGPAPVPDRPAAAALRQLPRLAALADPTRLQIVEMLAGLEEPLCVCEIVTHFALGQPTISHHLRVLRDAQLVTWEKRGLWVYYALNRAVLAGVTEYLDGLVSASQGSLRRTA